MIKYGLRYYRLDERQEVTNMEFKKLIAERYSVRKFENTYYFSNTFKKKTGISSSKFRQLAAADHTETRISNWLGLLAKQNSPVDK